MPIALDKFYSKVKATPEVSRFFSGQDHYDRAKGAQIGHWQSISKGRFDDDYVRNVQAIGRAHSRIGLEPTWYIAGYAIVSEHLIKSVIAECTPRGLFSKKGGIEVEELGELVASMVKAVFLDMDIAISVYISDEAEKARKKVMSETIAAERELVSEIFANALSHLAKKDVTFRITDDVPEAYENLKTNFNKSASNLEDALAQIGRNSSSIKVGMGEIKDASVQLSERTEAQAASVEKTAAAVEQMTANVRKTAESSKEAGGLVGQMKEAAVKSSDVVKDAVGAMDKIKDSSGQIANIIGIIDEIAFQTNLLALNAGVEAARAGDAGRGFAVVAQEVRELAQRSSQAAGEIKELINNSVSHVENGVHLVDNTGASLEAIVTSVAEVAEHVDAIAVASEEQAIGIEEINKAVTSIDRGTQQGAAMAEETTASALTLDNEISALTAMLAEFRTNGAEQPTNSEVGPQVISQADTEVHKKAARPQTVGNTALADEPWEEF